MKTLFLLFSALLVVGCNGPQIPGDGTLAVVDADPAFRTHSFTDHDTGERVQEIQAVRQGIRYWDEVGARLRLPDEVTPEEAARAIHFGLHRDDFSWPGEDIDGMDWYGLGYATVYPNSSPYVRYSADTFAQVVAHELGHAMGLGHIAEGEQGIMAAKANWWAQKKLSPADVALFQAVWGVSRTVPGTPSGPVRCRVDLTAPALSLVLPGGRDAAGDDCTIPDGGPEDLFQVGLHHADWTLVISAPRQRFSPGQPIQLPSPPQVDILYQGASGDCHDWTGTVTVVADGMRDESGWGISFDATCSTDPVLRVAGSLSGLVGPYY